MVNQHGDGVQLHQEEVRELHAGGIVGLFVLEEAHAVDDVAVRAHRG